MVAILTPSGDHLIQMLNCVVLNEYAALGGGLDWPGDDFFEDPSSSGSPTTWGTRIIGTDPDTGDPLSGQSMGTRSPGGSGGGRPKRRKGGSGFQPSKNTLTRTDATAGPRACFAGFVKVVITKPAPDPFGYNGLIATFTTTVGSCKPYNPPTIPQPATGLSLGSPNLITQVGVFLTANVGSDSYATVTEDAIQGPGISCTMDAMCPGFSALSYGGSGVGVIINPA